MDKISGMEALKRMRELRHNESWYFVMHFQTWNEARQQTDGMRVVKRCRLRAALPEDSVKPHPDLFLPYIDLDESKINQNRMCYKRNIKFVAFPPKFELLEVDWYSPINDNAQNLNEI